LPDKPREIRTIKHPDENLVTPIYIKTDQAEPWPDESMFYVLGRNGLFRCRNHEFFTSSVPSAGWPSELAEHPIFLKPRYPKLPQAMLEQIVGFFDVVYELHKAEAAVLLVWDKQNQQILLEVPNQTNTVHKGWMGARYPMDVHYETPVLQPGLLVFGDVHSHPDTSAYASMTDKYDEKHRPGLHIVVGRIDREPPELNIEAVADGTRFDINAESVLEGYEHRNTDIPSEWLDKITIDLYSYQQCGQYRQSGSRTNSCQASDDDDHDFAWDARKSSGADPGSAGDTDDEAQGGHDESETSQQ